MAKALEIEKPDPAEKPVPPLPKADDLAPPKTEGKEKLDTSGLEQFLKTQIGDRYAGVAAPAGEGVPAPEAKPEPEPAKEKKAAKEKPAAEKKKPEPEPEKAKTPAAPPAKPFKPKPAPAAPLTQEQIAAAAAEGATRALAAAKPKESESKTKEPELSPQDQRKVAILARMEELNGDKYKGITDKYKASIVQLEKYAKDWEKEHPGQEFDEESPEHEDFFKKHDVDWSDDDFTEALADIRAEKRIAEAAGKTDSKLAELERAETLRQKAGEIASHQNVAAQNFWKNLGDDVADMVNADGTLNMERVDQLKQSDPESLGVQVGAAQALDVEVAEIYKLYNNLTPNDPEHNEVHRVINRFAAEKEKELAAKPTQEKMNTEGQVFLPAAQYYRLPKGEREAHWTFTAGDLAFLRATDLATATKQRVTAIEERHMAWAKARGFAPEEKSRKPESPSAGGESRMAAVGEEKVKNSTEPEKKFLQDFIGR